MSTSEELESRVARLETTLAEIDARLAKLEHRRGGQPPPAVRTAEGGRPPLAVAGICSLILGGAFVLRALTESHVLPPLAGAILGLAYAAFWIWRADRYYAITAAVIAFPLVWETTVRFHIITPDVASILIAIFGLLFLRKDPVLAWVGSAGAIAAAFAIGPSVAMLIAISLIGVFAKKYEYVSWAPAIAANIIAPILIVTHPPGTPIALGVYAALWQLLPVQSSISSLIGIGGASWLLIPDHRILAAVWCVTGLIAAELRRRAETPIWIVAATVLTPLAGLAAMVAFFRVRWREERLVLLGVVAYSAFMGINSIVNAPLIHTVILVSFASLLGFIPTWETRILARIVLVAGGLQILIEDLRLGSAAMLVIAFALYGVALIIVSQASRFDIRKLRGGAAV